jgi:hypothetical protein
LPLRNALDNKLLRQALVTGKAAEQHKKELQEIFNCPIAYELAVLPAITTAGQHYDFASIQESLVRVGPRDPITRQELHADGVVFNRAFSQLLFLYADIDQSIAEMIRDRLHTMREDIERSEEQLHAVQHQVKKYKNRGRGCIGLACAMEIFMSVGVAGYHVLGDGATLNQLFMILFCVPPASAIIAYIKLDQVKAELVKEEQRQRNNLATKNLLAEQEHAALARFLPRPSLPAISIAAEASGASAGKEKSPLTVCSMFNCCCSSGAKDEDAERLTEVVTQDYGTNGAPAR